VPPGRRARRPASRARRRYAGASSCRNPRVPGSTPARPSAPRATLRAAPRNLRTPSEFQRARGRTLSRGVERRCFSSARTPAPISFLVSCYLFFRLSCVSFLPLGEDPVAILRREREVVLDEALVEIRGQVRQRRPHVGVRDEREVLREVLVGIFGGDPVHQLL